MMGILVTHHFSQRYHFKGAWGDAGKVVKQIIYQLEVTAVQKGITRFSNAWDCYTKLKGKLSMKCVGFYAPVAEFGPDLLGRGPFTVTCRFLRHLQSSRAATSSNIFRPKDNSELTERLAVIESTVHNRS